MSRLRNVAVGLVNLFRRDRLERELDPPDGRYPTRTDRVRESDAALNRAAALAALFFLAAGGSAAQPQPFLERVEVARVVIDVRVVDDDGQPVPGLTPEDFEVRIGDEPVRVETALWVGSDEPEAAAVEAVRAADAADSPDLESPGARVGEISQMLDTYYGRSPDPESPGARVGESRGRLIVFIVQNSTRLLQSRVYGLLRLLRKSEGLLAAVTPSDRVAVLSFGFHLQIWVDFTDDLDRVRTLLAGEVRTGRPPVLEAGERNAVVVNQAFARRFWSGQNAVGRRVGRSTVVGVVEDGHFVSFREAAIPFVFLSMVDVYSSQVTFHMRGVSAEAVRRAIERIDPAVPVASVATMSETVDTALLPARIAAFVSGLVGAVGLALACIGLFGTLSYVVAQRAPEIGLRVALGARALQIVRLVAGGTSVKLVAAGVVLGAGLGSGLAPLLQAQFSGAGGVDLVTLAGAAACLALVASVAVGVPAARALRIDPAEVLRVVE